MDGASTVRDLHGGLELGGIDGPVVLVEEEPYAGTPVRVVSEGTSEEGASPDSRTNMESLHHELADRSPTATHSVIERADHLSLLVEPWHAREVAAVTIDLLDAARVP